MLTAKNDLLAVIVPVYNVAPYLARCVNSIREQTYANLEIIMVDDGSTDGSGALCDDYANLDQRIKVIHQKNGGLSAARNTGLTHVTARYVTFVDSDDYLERDYMRVLYATLQDADAPLAICGVNTIDMHGQVTTNVHGERMVCTPRAALMIMLQGNGIVPETAYAKLYAVALFEQIKFPVGRLHEDVAIMPQLLTLCDKVAIYAVPLYNYCLRADSLTTGSMRMLMHADYWFYHEAAYAYARTTYPADVNEIDCCEMRMKLWAYQYLVIMNGVDPTLKRQLWRYLKQKRGMVLRHKILSPREQQLLRRTYWGRWGFTVYCRLREYWHKLRAKLRGKR